MGQSGYHYNAAQIRLLRNDIVAALNALNNALNETSNSCKTLSTSTTMKGEGADKIKDYVSTVHGSTICTGLAMFAEVVLQNILEYETQYHDVDSAIDAVIDTDELSELKTALEGLQGDITSLAAKFVTLSNTVEDISAYSYKSDRSKLNEWISDNVSTVGNLINSIGAIETSSFDIDKANNMLDSIQSIITRGGGLSPENFDRTAYLSSKDYAVFYESMKIANESIAELSKNAEHRKATIEAIEADWQIRAEQAEKAKLGIAIVASVAMAACVILLPGVGVLGAAAIGGVVGFAKGAINESIDQWGSGALAANEGFDLVEIENSAVIGSLEGMASGAIGAGFGSLSAGSSVLGKVGWSIAEEAVTNVTDTGISLVDATLHGNLSEEWGQLKKEMASGEYFIDLAGKSVTTGVTGTVLKEGIGDLSDDIFGKPASHTFKQYAKEVTTGSTKKIVTKSVEDFTDCTIETFVATDEDGHLRLGTEEEWKQNLQETNEKVKNPRTLFSRGISGGMEGGLKEWRMRDTPSEVYVMKSGGPLADNEGEIYYRTEGGQIAKLEYTYNKNGITSSRDTIIDGRTKEAREFSSWEKNYNGMRDIVEKENTRTVTVIKSTTSGIKWNISDKNENPAEQTANVASLFSSIPAPIY